MGFNVFELFAKIGLDTSEYEKGLSKASQDFKSFSTNAKKVFDSIEGVGKKAGSVIATGLKGFATASTAVAGFGGAAVNAGMNFDAAMSQVAAVSGATGSSFDALRNKAIEMGAKTQFSATEAAEAMNYMAMAGWKDQDMLNGISGIMNLAAASGENLATTSDIVTDALTAFGMTAGDSGHFADVLAVASSNANTNVGMMGETFKYVAPIAGAMGYTAEDTALAIGLMANSSIKGSQAGTTLRSIMTRLAKPTKESGAAMEALGISITNNDGSMKSLGDIIGDLRTSFAGLTSEEQASYAAMLAGQEGMSGLLAIVNAAPADVDKLTTALNNADGAAEKMAATMMDNLAGDIKLFKSALESLQITVSDALTPMLRSFTQFGTQAMEQLTMGFQEGGVDGMLDAFSTLIPMAITGLMEWAPDFAKISVKFMLALADGLLDSAEPILNASREVIGILIDGFGEWLSVNVDSIVRIGMDVVETIFDGFTQAGSLISTYIDDFIPLIVNAFLSYHEALFTVGIEILGAIGRGLSENKDKVRSMASETIRNMAEALIKNAPDIIDGAIALIDALAGAIADNWPIIVQAGGEIIGKLVEGITGSTPAFIGAMGFLLPHIGKVIDTIGNIKNVFGKVADFITGEKGIKKILSEGKKLGSGISKLKTGFSALTSAIGLLSNPVTAIIAVIATLAAGIIYLWNTNEDFRNAVKGIWDAIVGFFQAAGEKIQQAWSAIVEFFQGVWDGIVNIFQNVGQWFSDVFSAASQGIQNAWQGIAEFFQGIWDAITGVFEGIAEFFANLFGGAWEGVKETTSSAWEGITTFLGDTWEGIKTTAGDIFDNVKEGIGNAWNWVDETSHTVWDGLTGWLGDTWDWLTGKSDESFGATSQAIKEKWLDTDLTTRMTWDELQKYTSDVWQAMQKGSEEKFKAIYNHVHKNWEAADEDSKATWSGIESVLEGTWAGLEATSDTRFNAMKDNVEASWQEANASTTTQWGHIVTTVSDGAFAALTAVGENFGQMEGTVVEKLGLARGAAMGVDFSSVGTGIVDGMSAGVRARAQALAGSVVSAASMALNAAKAAMGIHSPSTVFRDIIGLNIGAGMAVGVDKSRGRVVDSILSVTDSIQEAFNPTFAMDFPAVSAPVDFASTRFQYSSGAFGNGAGSPVKGMGNMTVNIYSPEPVDAIQAERVWKKNMQRLTMPF